MRDQTASTLTAEEVRRIARLSRLALGEDEVEPLREGLGAVLGYVRRLADLDLQGVEPLTSVASETNRLADDLPGPMLSNETVMRLAPDAMPPFIKVPKVFGDDAGA